MKNRNNIDELFREALADYRTEPSIGLWRRIERRFFPPSRFSPTGLITSIFLLILAGSMPWILIPANNQEEKEPDLTSQNTRRGYLMKPATLPANGQNMTTMAQDERVFSIEPVYYEANTELTYDNPASLMIAAATDPANDLSILPWLNTYTDGYSTLMEESAEENLNYYTDRWIYRMISRKTGLMHPGFASYDPPVTRDLTVKSSFSDQFEDKYVRKVEISYGLNFIPSVVFYDPNPYNQMLGAEGIIRYKISSFNLQTGIGYSRMQDVGSYRIDYTSLDSVGYFLNVISFWVDPRNPGQYILQTREEAIYDSVPHYTLAEKTNKYDYIDIPLYLGYTFLQKGRVSLTANAGIKFSFLVNKIEPTVDFSVTNGELTGIERQVPVRMNTNWRFTAGLNFGYLLTDQFSFHLEPVYEQYISPVYVRQPGYEPRKPMVTGIKAGILFHF